MEAYYRARAGTYDTMYALPEWQRELTALRAWVARHAKGRAVLEVAAGTGYWTAAAAATAKAIVATDVNPAVLALATERRLGPHVAVRAADAYALPDDVGRCDVGMAHLWWSHVPKQSQAGFLRHLATRLAPRATILMIDQVDREGARHPTFRRDRLGNRYELRVLEDGTPYQIIKNYPTDAELRECLATICDNVEIKRLRHFWRARGRVRTVARPRRTRHH